MNQEARDKIGSWRALHVRSTACSDKLSIERAACYICSLELLKYHVRNSDAREATAAGTSNISHLQQEL